MKSRPEDRFISAWRAAAVAANETPTNPALQDARVRGISTFTDRGFPEAKSELWKYTPVRPRVERLQGVGPSDLTTLPDASVIAEFDVPGMSGPRAVLVDGCFAPGLSDLSELPRGVVVCGFRDPAAITSATFATHYARYADEAGDGFVSLNTAFSTDGLFIHVPKGVELPTPVRVLQVGTTSNRMVHARILYVVDEGAQARFVEVSRSTGATFSNHVSEVYTAPRARVDHVRLVDEHPDSVQVYHLQAHQVGDSYFATNVLTLSGGMVRNNLSFLPDGEYCETHLAGLYLGRDKAHIDNHSLVDHAKPNCVSNELFKGILDDHSTGVFNGKVLVRLDAQKTNAYQTNKSILLTDTARTFAKPELEIYADDVKCSHGATTGQLDRDAIFYLRSRGIRLEQARLMLLRAFVVDVLDRIEDANVRAHVDARVDQLLHA